jgi:hypothetical protein
MSNLAHTNLAAAQRRGTAPCLSDTVPCGGSAAALGHGPASGLGDTAQRPQCHTMARPCGTVTRRECRVSSDRSCFRFSFRGGKSSIESNPRRQRQPKQSFQALVNRAAFVVLRRRVGLGAGNVSNEQADYAASGHCRNEPYGSVGPEPVAEGPCDARVCFRGKQGMGTKHRNSEGKLTRMDAGSSRG